MGIGDSFLLFSFSFSNCLSLWLQITEGLKKLCGKNTVPQKPKKNPKTPKETNKKKSKGNYNIYIRAAVQILQPTYFLFTIEHCQHSTDKCYTWDECS